MCDTEGACTEQELTIETGGNITVFNALSPNNDGKNESLIIQYIDVLPTTQENTVTIYNRWGDEVWQGDNYDNTTVVFSGKNKSNKDLPSGIYFYKISHTNRVFGTQAVKARNYLDLTLRIQQSNH